MINKTISHYKIIEKIGEGGMGVVYKAVDTNLKRFVALKFLPTELSRDKAARERFIQEAQSASALDHPNICTIHEIGKTDDNQMFIAMGYYEGETLRAKIAKGPSKIDEAIDIVIQVATGLARAHESGIIHRDIKPANIIITDRGEVKILDFGLAKLAGSSQMTKTGMTLGTVFYMSPDQARGEKIDHKTDIWSLGVVLYEMLTGHLPFKGEYDQAVVYSILNDEPTLPSSSRKEIMGNLEQIVMKALEKKPTRRFQNIDEMNQALETTIKKPISDSTRILTPPTKTTSDETMLITSPKKPNRYIFSIIGSILGLILIILFIKFMPLIFQNNKDASLPINEKSEENAVVEDDNVKLQKSNIVTVRLSINPNGAEVFFDSEKIGTTPLDPIKKTKGQYRIGIRKRGYAPYFSIIYINNDTLISRSLELQIIDPPLPSVGTLIIASEPAEPKIYVDDKLYLSSSIGNLSAGEHNIKLQMSGYLECDTTIIIKQGQETRLDVKLLPLLGAVSVLVEPYGDIYIDEKLIKEEVDTWYTHPLKIGAHIIRLEHPPSRKIWEKTIQIVHGETLKTRVDFNKKINIQISAKGVSPGWGHVYIDGKVYIDDKNIKMETPGQLSISVGIHKIEVKHEELNIYSEERIVLIDEGGETKFMFILIQKK